MLATGLRRARAWADAGRPLPIAVNLSPRTIVDHALPERVAAMLAEHGVPAEMLTLEIAEDGVIGEMDRPLPTLRRLDALGVRLSVDDFGTGYSSLSYLRRLPVDEVKIDRSFVQGMATDPGDLAIVRAIVDLARHFDLQVVAEGVESELTLSLLLEMGCDVGQGFLFSRPLPYDRLEAWIAARTDEEPTPRGRGPAAPGGAVNGASRNSFGRGRAVDPVRLGDRRRVLSTRCASRVEIAHAPLAQTAERLHGKEKVYGSIP